MENQVLPVVRRLGTVFSFDKRNLANVYVCHFVLHRFDSFPFHMDATVRILNHAFVFEHFITQRKQMSEESDDDWWEEPTDRVNGLLEWNFYVRPTKNTRGYIKRDPRLGIGIASPLTEESNLMIRRVNGGELENLNLGGKQINRMTFRECKGMVMECECYPDKVNVMTLGNCTIADDPFGPETYMTIKKLVFSDDTRLESGHASRRLSHNVYKVAFVSYRKENVQMVWDILRDLIPRGVLEIDLTDSWNVTEERYYDSREYTDEIIKEYNDMVFFILENFPFVSRIRFLASQKFTKRQMTAIEKRAQTLLIDRNRFDIKTVDVSKHKF